ncbi:MAG: ABC transporter permease subunit [bacterium]|nr:ABC transporter permease subunit [bacterium]
MQAGKYRSLRLGAYLLLIAGSLLFSFPFIWMVMTSAKVDSELFTEKFELLPGTPNHKPRSPFIDHHEYRYAVTDLTRPHLALIGKVVRDAKYPIPPGIDEKEVIAELTRGFARKLEQVLPPSVWEAGPAAIEREARKQATFENLRAIFDRVYRILMIGQLRIRSNQFQEQELGAGVPFSQRFVNKTPEVLRLVDGKDRATPCAYASYDFSKGDHWRLEQTFTTSFDVHELQRLRLYARPDDNWHRLYCHVEKLGALYEAVRPTAFANYDWAAIGQWQEPGPEDDTNKIKFWTHLKEIDRGPQYESDPHKLKVIFETRRSNALQAWWSKINNNFYRTLAFMDVWRYTATSLYLVILNITLTMLSCSLVAYSITRLRWPGRDFCFILMLATMMIPAQVTLIPGFLIWKTLGFYNTLVPLWLGAAFAAPFYVFLLRQYLKGVPKDLEDAAYIDGCSYFRIYWHIMLPLMKPTLAVIAIWTFMGAWNNFMGPLIYIADQRLYPLAFGLFAFSTMTSSNPALTMAGSFIMTMPIIIIFFFAQRYFIEGITLTGMKA